MPTSYRPRDKTEISRSAADEVLRSRDSRESRHIEVYVGETKEASEKSSDSENEIQHNARTHDFVAPSLSTNRVRSCEVDPWPKITKDEQQQGDNHKTARKAVRSAPVTTLANQDAGQQRSKNHMSQPVNTTREDPEKLGEAKDELRQQVTSLTADLASLEEQVSRLAKQLTHRSMRASSVGEFSQPLSRQSSLRVPRMEPPENTFLGALDEDSALNPWGQSFDYSEWIRNLAAMGSNVAGRSISLSWRNLQVYGTGPRSRYQMDLFTSLLVSISGAIRRVLSPSVERIQILEGFDGLLEKGEMLLALGRPGSGCSTLLKTLTAEMNGIVVDQYSQVNYQGVLPQQIQLEFRGDAIYTAEQDVHFPQLTVSQTLGFAARARIPRNRPSGISPEIYADHIKDVVMSVFGLSHCADTRVGNEYIRGVSGGERKRVSLAEATLNGSPLQAWDNSTRGLDSANAIDFCTTLSIQSKLFKRTTLAALYQAPEAAYCLFNKVTLLYEGRQIYFGRTEKAKQYFEDMGFVCPKRQTTADFLTSLTNPEERVIRRGFENSVPRSADDFALVWKKSSEYKELMKDINAYNIRYPIGGQSSIAFQESRNAEGSNKSASPYMITSARQIRLCIGRGIARLRADSAPVISGLISQLVLSLVIGSMVYNMQPTSDSLFERGALLFYAILINAFSCLSEVLTIYAQRPVVEKHTRYALYRPSAEAVSAILCDLPIKIAYVFLFSTPLYFLANLRREPVPYFWFLLIMFATTMALSLLFRAIAAMSRSLAQALAPATILTIGVCLYSGFPIPVTAMPRWSRWMSYINPMAYGFEAILVNELSGRNFNCTTFVPSGPGYASAGPNQICNAVGATPGETSISGDTFLAESFQYYHSNLVRNVGILMGFLGLFTFVYLLAAEFVKEEPSKGEILIFQRKHLRYGANSMRTNLEDATVKRPMRLSPKSAGLSSPSIKKHSSVIHWHNICYEVNSGKGRKQILHHIDGWVKPGTCTALMGASGAGKTTLLDVLAARVRTGVISGDILVDGVRRDSSFQRKTGYVQQADLHLSTSTVREALQFSAILRQSAQTPMKDRLAYVEEVIQLMEMQSYAEAIVGVPGEGLNVEQRKRLTIAIELVAKPDLLILLDEPTSGLDSQTAFATMEILDTLKKHGQAILCTIHQPSATLFQRFDRLLLLDHGRTVYFGAIGHHCTQMITYFMNYGAEPCTAQRNPAEWMLDVINQSSTGEKGGKDWYQIWQQSRENQYVQYHLNEMARTLPPKRSKGDSDHETAYTEYANPFTRQLMECGRRELAHYWRSPSYLWSKFALSTISALYIGLTFINSINNEQGVQNKIFAIFMMLTIFGNFTAQTMRSFVTQRSVFEARESPARIYSWLVFILVNIFVEMVWNTLVAVVTFICWYYPIGLYHDAGDGAAGQAGLAFLYFWAYMMFASTFAFMIIAGFTDLEQASGIGGLLFALSLTCCGVIVRPSALPRFWIFLYRVSPLTYLIAGLTSTTVGNSNMVCSDVELLRIPPPAGSTCEQYLGPFLQETGAALRNQSGLSNGDCLLCPSTQTNTVLQQFDIYYDDRWRDFGLIMAYAAFNLIAALCIYWLVRRPRQKEQNSTSRTKSLPADPNSAGSDSTLAPMLGEMPRYLHSMPQARLRRYEGAHRGMRDSQVPTMLRPINYASCQQRDIRTSLNRPLPPIPLPHNQERSLNGSPGVSPFTKALEQRADISRGQPQNTRTMANQQDSPTSPQSSLRSVSSLSEPLAGFNTLPHGMNVVTARSETGSWIDNQRRHRNLGHTLGRAFLPESPRESFATSAPRTPYSSSDLQDPWRKRGAVSHPRLAFS